MKYTFIIVLLSFGNLFGQIDSIVIHSDWKNYRTDLHFSKSGELKIIRDNNAGGLAYNKYFSGIAFRNTIDKELTSTLFKKINNLDRCEACIYIEPNDPCHCNNGGRTHSTLSTMGLYKGDSLEHTFMFYIDEENKPMQISVFKELFELIQYPNKQKWDPSNFDIQKLKREDIISIELIKYELNEGGRNRTKVNLESNEFGLVTNYLNKGKKEYSFENGKLLNINENKTYYVLVVKHKNSGAIKYKNMGTSKQEVYYIDEKYIRLKKYSKVKLDDGFEEFLKEKFK